MTDDLERRLREPHAWQCLHAKGDMSYWRNSQAPTEAADEIARLRAENEALQAENFKLAAGACNVEGGLIGDDHGHFDCALKARIEQLEREQSWQPIETAPKDGTRLLATDGVNVTVVEWKVYSGRWEKLTGWNHLYGARWNGPVAWRPLPDAAIRNGERG